MAPACETFFWIPTEIARLLPCAQKFTFLLSWILPAPSGSLRLKFSFKYPRGRINFFTRTSQSFLRVVRCLLWTCHHFGHYRADKFFNLASHPTSALPEISNYTKYRLDCKWIWMFFPAAPIRPSCCSCVGFLPVLLLLERNFSPQQQKTLEARAAEIQMEEKLDEISYVYNEWMGKSDEEKKYTNVQKSHFYLCCWPPSTLPCLRL